MAEFYIIPDNLKAQATRLDDVAASITATQLKVAAVAAGLGPIGLAAVGANILAIEGRLQKHKMKVDALSEALTRIGRQYLFTEAAIQGEVLQFIIDQIVQGAVDGITGFIDGVNGWIEAYTGLIEGLIGLPEFELIEFEGLGGAIGVDLTASLFNFENFYSDGYAQLFDENGNFNPEAFAFFSGEGSVFSLDGNFNFLDWLSGNNTLTIGEYNVDALVQAGLLDADGNINPQFAAYLDGEFIELHDIATINFNDFHQGQYDIRIGDIVIHGGAGNTWTETGAGAYGSATAFSYTDTQRYGFDFLNFFTTEGVTLCSAEAGAGVDFGLLDQDGHFNPHFFVGEVADAAILTGTGSAGISIAGIDISAGATVSAGDVGEGVFAYMHDGQIVVNTGIGLGAGGASLVLSADMSNSAIYQYGQAAADYVISGQMSSDINSAVNYVTSGEAWSDAQAVAYDAYDYVASGEAWNDVQNIATDAYDYVSSGEAWSDFTSGVSDTYDYFTGGDFWEDFTSWGVGN